MSATTVRSVHVDQGELRFVVEIGGDEHRVRFGVDPPIVPSADGALPAVLLPAMTCGERLRFEQPIDEALLRNLPDVQAIFRAWADAWPFFRGTPREIEVDATPALADRAPGRAVAAFFSGGVDSFSTVLSHPEITHLVFVHGADLAIGESELAGRVASRLEHAAELLGKSWIAVETDVRLLGGRLRALGRLLRVRAGECRPVAVASRRAHLRSQRISVPAAPPARVTPADRPPLGRGRDPHRLRRGPVWPG